MTITVAKLKRALEAMRTGYGLFPEERSALELFISSPRALTILAEKLSERPDWYIMRASCTTKLGNVCKEGERCCQRNPAPVSRGITDALSAIEEKRRDFDYVVEARKLFPPPQNAAREGFICYFVGKSRLRDPFPPNRRDLHEEYKRGWDAAEATGRKPR